MIKEVIQCPKVLLQSRMYNLLSKCLLLDEDSEVVKKTQTK